MSPLLTVRLPIRLVSEANKRGHWKPGAARAAGQRATVKLALSTVRLGRPVAMPCAVRLTRIAPGRLDDDNLARACKAVRDQVAEWLGVDDRDPRVTWRCEQERGGVREYAVRIEVFERAAWRTVLVEAVA